MLGDNNDRSPHWLHKTLLPFIAFGQGADVSNTVVERIVLPE